MAISRRDLLKYGAAAAGAAALSRRSWGQSAPINLVFSHHVPTSHLIHGVAEKFAEKVKQGTNGAVTISIRPASQLFNLRTSAEALQLGTLDMCWTDLGTLGNWQPQFGFVSLPFLFNNYDHVKKVLYGPIGQQVSKDAKDSLGVEVLSSRRFGLSRLPVEEADPDGRRRSRPAPARTRDSDLGRDGEGARCQSDADPGGGNLHGAADRRDRRVRVAGRLHLLQQELRGCRLRHPHAPHLHRGVDDGERQEDGVAAAERAEGDSRRGRRSRAEGDVGSEPQGAAEAPGTISPN